MVPWVGHSQAQWIWSQFLEEQNKAIFYMRVKLNGNICLKSIFSLLAADVDFLSLCCLQYRMLYIFTWKGQISKAMSGTMHWKTTVVKTQRGMVGIKKAAALAVEWLRQRLAPELVLEFVSCKCKKNKCSNGMCDCFMVGLSCTNICRYLNCVNRTFAQDEEQREG